MSKLRRYTRESSALVWALILVVFTPRSELLRESVEDGTLVGPETQQNELLSEDEDYV